MTFLHSSCSQVFHFVDLSKAKRLPRSLVSSVAVCWGRHSLCQTSDLHVSYTVYSGIPLKKWCSSKKKKWLNGFCKIITQCSIMSNISWDGELMPSLTPLPPALVQTAESEVIIGQSDGGINCTGVFCWGLSSRAAIRVVASRLKWRRLLFWTTAMQQSILGSWGFELPSITEHSKKAINPGSPLLFILIFCAWMFWLQNVFFVSLFWKNTTVFLISLKTNAVLSCYVLSVSSRSFVIPIQFPNDVEIPLLFVFIYFFLQLVSGREEFSSLPLFL